MTSKRFLRKSAVSYMTVFRELLNSVLCIVVVPGDPIVIQECEKSLAIFLKPLLILDGTLRRERLLAHLVDKLQGLPFVLLQMPSLQPKSVHGVDNGPEQ